MANPVPSIRTTAYPPLVARPSAISSLCFLTPTIFPREVIHRWGLPRLMVDRRCAEATVLVFIRLSSASCTIYSDSVSRAEVASSGSGLEDFWGWHGQYWCAGAATREFAAPVTVVALSYPFSVNHYAKSWALAILAAFSTCSGLCLRQRQYYCKEVSLKSITYPGCAHQWTNVGFTKILWYLHR